jgi:hypothetical protein
MRRIAYVESKDGTDPNAFRGPDVDAGLGIWQMNKTTFDRLTTTTTDFPNIREKYYPSIEKRFCVNIAMLQRRDLYRPLVAALLTRVYLLTIPTPIPSGMRDQTVYWNTYYNTEASSEKFWEDARMLEGMRSEESQTSDEGLSSDRHSA